MASRRTLRRFRAGLTLVEAMIGMVVAGTACFAGLSGLLMSLRTADSNLLALESAATVRAVGEQILSIDYLSLFKPELPVDVPSQPTGTLKAGEWNTRLCDFRYTPGTSSDDLQLRIKPVITRFVESDGVDFAQVVLNYEWQDSTFFVSRTRTDSIVMLVASVSSY